MGIRNGPARRSFGAGPRLYSLHSEAPLRERPNATAQRKAVTQPPSVTLEPPPAAAQRLSVTART